MDKILLVSDGIIFIGVAVQDELNIQVEKVEISVEQYGAKIQILDKSIYLPAVVLAHLEEAAGTNIYFYEADPYQLIADYRGSIELNRDEVLKIKGAWEYQAQFQAAQ